MRCSTRCSYLPIIALFVLANACGEWGPTIANEGDPGRAGDSQSYGDSIPDFGDGGAPHGDSAYLPPGGDNAGQPCGPPAAVIHVSVADLHAATQGNEPYAVVDVREPSETASGVVAGALLFPWNSGVLSATHDALPSDRPLYIICRSGGRSSATSTFLVEQGHLCVHNVQGGMNAWTSAGYATSPP